MLSDAFSQKQLTEIPYPETFALLDRLSNEELKAARDALDTMIDNAPIHTAGWIPGADWSNTAFQPIYEKAAKRNQTLAAKVFGVLVFDVFIHRDETWYTLRADKDGEPIGSRTYFMPKN